MPPIARRHLRRIHSFAVLALLACIAAFLAPRPLPAQDFNFELVGQCGGTANAMAVEGNRVYIAEGPHVFVYDVTIPQQPLSLGRVRFSDTVTHVDVKSGIVWAALGATGVQGADFSFPTAPQLLGAYDTAGFARGVKIENNQLFVADGSTGLAVLDVANPFTPVWTGGFDTPGEAYALCVRPPLVYIADGGAGLAVVDCTNSTSLIGLSQFNTPGVATDLDEAYGIVLLSDGYAGFKLIDVSQPTAPIQRGQFTDSDVGSVKLKGLVGIVDLSPGIYFFDVSDPSEPTQIGYLPQAVTGASALEVRDDLLFLLDPQFGLHVDDISNLQDPSNLLLRHDAIGAVKSVTMADRYAHVIDYKYQLTPFYSAIDLSNAWAPNFISAPQAVYSESTWHSVELYSEFALVAAGFDGVRVADITPIATPKWIEGALQPGDLRPFNTDGRTWEVKTRSQWAFLADGFNGFVVYDLTDPANPVQASHLPIPSGAFALELTDSLAYIATGITGLSIVDISNPASLLLKGFVDTPDFAEDLAVNGTTVCIADRASGVQVINVSDPLSPLILGAYNTPGSAVDVAMLDSLVFVADSASGIHALDITSPATPTLVGSYNTPGTALGVALDQLHAYVADDTGGFLVLRYTGPNQPPFDDAQLVKYAVPPQLVRGSVTPVTFRMRNSGNTTWSQADGYSLAFTTDDCGLTSPPAVPLDPLDSIPPGGEHTFAATLTAPADAGPCTLVFEMSRTGPGPFGQRVTLTPEIIAGENDSAFVNSTIPPMMAPNQSLWVGVRFQNTGASWWTPATNHDLAVVTDSCNLLGGVTRLDVAPDAAVGPGVGHQFLAYLTAPSVPGSCDLAFRMIEGDDPPPGEYFGPTYEATILIAQPPNSVSDWSAYE